MKHVATTVAMGMCLALAAGTAFASESVKHDGRRNAHEEQSESRIYGTVMGLPNGLVGIWNVNGREINVTKATHVKQKHGKAEVGAYVEVEGSLSGKVLNAYKIEVKRGSKEARKPRGTTDREPLQDPH